MRRALNAALRRRLSPEQRLARFAPFRAMGVQVVETAADWRRIRLLLPLNARNRNPGGSMFGGCIASLADPVAALACARVFPGHSVWTRAMSVDFRREGRADLELRFALTPEEEARIGDELQRRGRATPTLEYGIYLPDGGICAWVSNTVAIRPDGYRPRTRDDQDGEQQ